MYLYGVEIELGGRFARPLRQGRGGTSAHPDGVSRPADLDDQHPDLTVVFFGVAMVLEADAAAEHDRLEPLAPLLAAAVRVREALAKRAGVTADEGLAKLVTVVGGAVGGVDQDLEGRGERTWVRVRLVFPFQVVPGDLQGEGAGMGVG